jgi:hypothetical protein
VSNLTDVRLPAFFPPPYKPGFNATERILARLETMLRMGSRPLPRRWGRESASHGCGEAKTDHALKESAAVRLMGIAPDRNLRHPPPG